MSDEILARLRTLCLAFPEVREQDEGSVGSPAFKVREKIFAMRHNMEENPSLWCKAPPGVQGMLVGSDPQRFFVPPYVGRYGWIGIWLNEKTEWDLLADLVRDSYIITAPRRLAAQIK